MADCCSASACVLEQLRTRQRSTLRWVLVINAAMFIVELLFGLAAGSTALVADSLDMLGDALVYGFSLYVVAKNDAWKAFAALCKGAIMGAFGLFVLAQAGYKVLYPAAPQAEIIGAVGVAAMLANAICFALLWRHRAEDVNMRSVWLCSRNDIIANGAVLAAGAGVWLSQSQWPDVVVGLGIALLFLHSAVRVIQDAVATYRAHRATVSNDPHT